MTRANQTTQKGNKQVIEVIDTGIEATHQAFSGSMDGVDVRLSQGDVEALVGLGWSERDAAAAVAEAGGDSPEAGLPELLRASLRVLGARR